MLPGPWVRPVARKARVRARHIAIVFSFVLCVLVPAGVAYQYLWHYAADQYASRSGFSIRSGEQATTVELFGGISALAGNSNADADILYEFIQSQQMVRLVDAGLDLEKMFSKPKNDPLFAYDPSGTIEDLTRYWSRMITVHNQSGGRLLTLRVLGFTPQDAQQIATEIVRQSSLKINQLTAIARQDAIKYAQTGYDRALSNLKLIREKVIDFRNINQLVDPNQETAASGSVLANLHQKLTDVYIELDMLMINTRASDLRIKHARQKISVIENRIGVERRKAGYGAGDGRATFSRILGEYENLNVELEYAQQTYITAQSALESARARAGQQSRYLAAYIEPTLAERPEYPRRLTILGIGSLFLFLGWSLLVLVYFSIRDRR